MVPAPAANIRACPDLRNVGPPCDPRGLQGKMLRQPCPDCSAVSAPRLPLEGAIATKTKEVKPKAHLEFRPWTMSLRSADG